MVGYYNISYNGIIENSMSLKSIEQAGLKEKVEVEKRQDIDYFIKMGVFSTPALVIDGRVVSTSRVLNPDEIIKILENCGIN